ncbi:MAG TPA: glutamine--fructose-6-phosphate transaminase (isomerizing) [Atribacteraceae bacterium]|nr:glutamine--fructose-6-phosphate transaminase (isomerizing) [Atribacteraceae bacterium]
MCGIIGYTGTKQALPVLLNGLNRLAYRGYDSAGVAVEEDGRLITVRAKGKVSELERELVGTAYESQRGIGHTRWATHGIPSEHNAHPHMDCTKKVALVHNGIIENYLALRQELEDGGHVFSSETDSEVFVHLLEGSGLPLERLLRAAGRLRGSFACCILFQEEPGILYGVRMASPLLIGIGEGEGFLASDIPAILEYTRQVVFLDDGEVVRLRAGSWEVFDFCGNRRGSKSIFTVPWDLVRAEKGGFKHFMVKEIFEEPAVFEDVLAGRVNPLHGVIRLEELDGWSRSWERVVIVACGTAAHAGMLGKHFIERYARIPVAVEYASEFRYREPLIDERSLVIAVSQSGETADTLAAAELARRNHAPVLAICNTIGSSLTRLAERVLFTRAGPEIGVASTKAFLAQMAVFLLMALFLAERNPEKGKEERGALLRELFMIPRRLRDLLEDAPKIQELARQYYQYRHFLYLGRGVYHPLALEGALKLKEISYIHAEGLCAGEMKHGTIALVEPDVASLVLVGQGESRTKILGNLEEIRARQGKVLALTTSGDREVENKAHHLIEIPDGSEDLSPFTAIIPLQLFAYYVAVEKGCDVDQPRNLAKSVTVE